MTEKLTLREAVSSAVACDDVDEGIRHIQNALGIDDGGMAALFFDPPGMLENWKLHLRDYIRMELAFMEEFRQ